jgi:hypothetical protein
MTFLRVAPITLLTCVLLTAGCLTPPDDGMALGPEISADAVDMALYNAQSGVPDTDAFHINDKGVIQAVETIFSASKITGTHLYTITGMDSLYVYFQDYNVRTFETQTYKLQRNNPSELPFPVWQAHL